MSESVVDKGLDGIETPEEYFERRGLPEFRVSEGYEGGGRSIIPATEMSVKRNGETIEMPYPDPDAMASWVAEEAAFMSAEGEDEALYKAAQLAGLATVQNLKDSWIDVDDYDEYFDALVDEIVENVTIEQVSDAIERARPRVERREMLENLASSVRNRREFIEEHLKTGIQRGASSINLASRVYKGLEYDENDVEAIAEEVGKSEQTVRTYLKAAANGETYDDELARQIYSEYEELQKVTVSPEEEEWAEETVEGPIASMIALQRLMEDADFEVSAHPRILGESYSEVKSKLEEYYDEDLDPEEIPGAVRDLMDEIDSLEQQTDAMGERIHELEETYDEYVEDLRQALGEEAEGMSEEELLRAARDQREELIDTNEELEENLQKLENVRSTIEAIRDQDEVEDVESGLEGVLDVVVEADVDSIEEMYEQLEETQERLEETLDEYDELQAEYDDLEQKLEETEGDLEDVNSELEQERARNQELESQLGEKEIDAMEAREEAQRYEEDYEEVVETLEQIAESGGEITDSARETLKEHGIDIGESEKWSLAEDQINASLEDDPEE